MKIALVILAVALALGGCVLPPYGAHLAPNHGHIGYPPGSIIPIRSAEWFDETGTAGWINAQMAYNDNWENVTHLYNSAGHHLPYLAFRSWSSGHPGCGNELGGFDVCVGNLPRPANDGTGRTLVAITYTSLDGASHLLYSRIEVPSPGWGNPAQKVWIICHETGHILGLIHNTANPESCEQASMPNVSFPPQNLGQDDIQELLRFYDGHPE